MTAHEELRRSLGSYVMGALEPAERGEVDAHLVGCPACREGLARLAGLPALLSRLSVSEVTDAALVAPPTLLSQLLSSVEEERHRTAVRTSRWRTAALGLTATAAALAVALVVPAESEPRPESRPLAAVAGSTSSGTAALEERPWGTSVRLQLADLPTREGSFTAWAVDADGQLSAVATWGPTPAGVADVTGATAVSPDVLDRLVVSTTGGEQLLRLEL